MYIDIDIDVRIDIDIDIHIDIDIDIHIDMGIDIHIHMYICTYVHMYIRICIYIYIYFSVCRNKCSHCPQNETRTEITDLMESDLCKAIKCCWPSVGAH